VTIGEEAGQWQTEGAVHSRRESQVQRESEIGYKSALYRDSVRSGLREGIGVCGRIIMNGF
jgi:hypothetical protein